MSLNKQVRRIAIIGTGVIGASWAAQYLARGFDVIATNPDPKAETQLRKDIDAAWKELTSFDESSCSEVQLLHLYKSSKMLSSYRHIKLVL